MRERQRTTEKVEADGVVLVAGAAVPVPAYVTPPPNPPRTHTHILLLCALLDLRIFCWAHLPAIELLSSLLVILGNRPQHPSAFGSAISLTTHPPTLVAVVAAAAAVRGKGEQGPKEQQRRRQGVRCSGRQQQHVRTHARALVWLAGLVALFHTCVG